MDNIISMALGALQQIQGYKPYQLYESNPDEKAWDFHLIEASANMDCVPVDALKNLKWVREHELSMSLVHEIKRKLSGSPEILFCGNPNSHFGIQVSPDYLSCKLTLLTRKNTGDTQ